MKTSTAQLSLFVDFDGVLHPDGCPSNQLFSCLPILEGVLNNHSLSDIEVILSTSWRQQLSLDQIKKLLPHSFAERIIGINPSIQDSKAPTSSWTPGLDMRFHREAECMLWLKDNHRNSYGHSYLFLDDRPEWFSPDNINLVAIDASCGISADDALYIDQKIRERL